MIRKFFNRKLTRRQFLKTVLTLAALIPFAGLASRRSEAAEGDAFNGRPKKGVKGDYDLVSVRGDDPYAATVKAVESMGGMGRFVKQGDVVVVKPNIAWDRSEEQAANTNPLVVAALVDLARAAGAKKVNVFDITCNDARRCYAASGIEKAARGAGADVYFPDEWDTVKAQFGYPSMMESWPIVKDAVDCDVFINVPVLKHHRLTRLTLSMKNLMGVCAGERGAIHRDIGPKLVDLTRFINPDLTVIDANRVLVRNGPTGGNLDDVEAMKTVIVATDPTLADSYAARLAGVDPAEVPYIRSAEEQGYGTADIDSASILTLES